MFDRSRRNVLKWTSLGGAYWLTPVAELLAVQHEAAPREPAQSLILLWMAGGPSQLETFDPHPGSKIAGGTTAINTASPGVQLASGYEQLAEQMPHVSLIRSLVSKEGDHERGTYFVKTGYPPDATVIHPSIGAICCHQLPVGKTEIPRHISILPNQWSGRGGLLGNEYDAFRTFDPKVKVPDIAPRGSDARVQQRYVSRSVVDDAFATGRRAMVDATMHRDLTQRAQRMMTSEQLAAFDVTQEPLALRAAYGDTPFGRGCLAARRLIEVGVRCVEVTLTGWDSHANNHEIHRELAKTLDPAYATLLSDLQQRGLFGKTLVVCGGEFGRTPRLNRLEGRDHWPKGFSMAVSGGALRGGQVIGETDPEGAGDVARPVEIADLHATLLTALGIDPSHQELAPIGRPIKLSEGTPIPDLLTTG